MVYIAFYLILIAAILRTLEPKAIQAIDIFNCSKIDFRTTRLLLDYFHKDTKSKLENG